MDTNIKQQPTVLVVDDEQDLLLLMQFQLGVAGFKVKISLNGEDILDIIRSSSPDIILLDIRMHDIDGGTICHLLKTNKSTAHIPVLLFSANDNIKSITHQCGANGFIKKPFEIQAVKNIIANELDKCGHLPVAS